MKQILLLVSVPLFLIGMQKDDVLDNYYQAASNIVKAQPSYKQEQVNRKALADVMQRTISRRRSDAPLVQSLKNIEKNKISDISTLLLHTTNQLLLEAEQSNHVHALKTARQKEQYEKRVASYQTQQNYLFALSSIICVVLGWVLNGGC